MKLETITLAVLASALCAPLARAQDEAANALADCKAHQARVQDLEDRPRVDASASGWDVGSGELARERDVMERSCAYARGLMNAGDRAASAPARRPRPADPYRFRSDESVTAPPPAPPVPASVVPVYSPPPAPPSPPPMMRPAPPPQSNVGGTPARRRGTEADQAEQPPPQ